MENNDLEQLKAQYGNPEPQKPKKKWLPIVVSIAVVLVVAGIAVAALEILKSKPTTTASTTTTAQVTGGPAAKDVIDKITQNATIVGLKNYTLFRANQTQSGSSPDGSTVITSEPGYDFLTNVAPDDSLQFTLTNVDGPSSKSAVTTAIEQTLTDNGFSLATQDTSSLTDFTTKTYANKATICQIIDFSNGKLAGQEQSVLCVAGASIAASYANIKNLLDMADKSIATSAKTVTQSLVSSGNKKLITLIVSTGSAATANNYYFATLNTTYNYIGTKGTPNVDNAASYTVPTLLKNNIDDPKWGTFLSDNIQ
jgi:hypothetical protein